MFFIIKQLNEYDSHLKKHNEIYAIRRNTEY